MSSEEAVRADAMETVVEVRARRRDGGVESRETRARGVGRRAREGWEDARGDRRRSLARERGGIGRRRRTFERGRRARWDWWGEG